MTDKTDAPESDTGAGHVRGSELTVQSIFAAIIVAAMNNFWRY